MYNIVFLSCLGTCKQTFWRPLCEATFIFHYIGNFGPINHKIISNVTIYTTYLLCLQQWKLYKHLPPLPHVLSPVNETITHKSQNELMFSINRGELSDVMSPESITFVWFPKSLRVRKLKSYTHILKWINSPNLCYCILCFN